MSSKKNKKMNKMNPQVVRKPEVQPVSVDDVVESVTEAEFTEKRAALINQLNSELDALKNEKEETEKAVKNAKELSETLNNEIEKLREQNEELQAEYDAINSEYEKAVETIDTAKQQAEEMVQKAKEEYDSVVAAAGEEAEKIREAAEQEKMSALIKAADEARDKWKEQIDHLQKQIDEISRREKALLDAKNQLEKDRQSLELDREALEDEKSYISKKKDRYDSASPAKVEELERELQDEQTRYKVLSQKYKEQSERFDAIQVLLDTVKTEIEDVNGGKKIASLGEIVSQMQYFREQYEQLSEIHSRYPDAVSISALEEKAQRAEKLEREREVLLQERNRYREETVAANNVRMELEVVRQEVDATNALNEHLLQELQSHKTALESRTGDTCPALSKVDAETDDPKFIKNINARHQLGAIYSLSELVAHVKNYAGSNEHLIYKDDDIRAFLAGMAVSPLIILQGMSGTGKSSLPRVFSEAISGFNELIPVESSWRDRNELLGYYNDFNKKFNAKTFTVELYRCSKERCKNIPTFIVLDEMNIARIEYYFSDFLTILQKPEREKWLIELVPSDMRTLPMELPEDIKLKMRQEELNIFEIWQKIERNRQGDLTSETSDAEKNILTEYLAELGQLTGAKDLIDGRKIKVNNNVWFIGTANHDESTFDISDKVYDRAQVVSLNVKPSKREIEEAKFINTKKKFISVNELQKLFDAAINEYKKRDEVWERLDKLDQVLIEQFNTSFGHRIVWQAMDFVAVFTAAGGNMVDALDYQISSKILRKVISDDNAEAFLELLEVTKDYKETQKLIEKRIKDLK